MSDVRHAVLKRSFQTLKSCHGNFPYHQSYKLICLFDELGYANAKVQDKSVRGIAGFINQHQPQIIAAIEEYFTEQLNQFSGLLEEDVECSDLDCDCDFRDITISQRLDELNAIGRWFNGISHQSDQLNFWRERFEQARKSS